MKIREKITKKVESNGRLTRSDLVDLLNTFKTRQEAREGMDKWVDDEIVMLKKMYQGKWTVEQIKARLLTDMDSYGVKWPDRPDIGPRKQPTFEGAKSIKIPDTGTVEPDPTLLSREKELLVQINKLKAEGKHKEAMSLTGDLIEIQKQQPMIPLVMG